MIDRLIERDERERAELREQRVSERETQTADDETLAWDWRTGV